MQLKSGEIDHLSKIINSIMKTFKLILTILGIITGVLFFYEVLFTSKGKDYRNYHVKTVGEYNYGGLKR